MASDPLSQFKVIDIVPIAEVGGQSIAFTNSALFMILATAISIGFVLLGSRGRTLVPSRFQSLVEVTYGFIESALKDVTGKEGMRFFPLVFSLFLFILVANLIGMFPYFFTVTSHISVTFVLAMIVILTVVIFGLMKNGLKFFKLFVPSGVPLLLMPLVVLIEVISFVSRPISLSVRLFANMLGGHITLKVFAGFVVSLGSLGAFGIVGAFVPLFFTMALTALEFLVAFLQAYVFALLTCIYLNDALHPSH